jgi:hypothetical protein
MSVLKEINIIDFPMFFTRKNPELWDAVVSRPKSRNNVSAIIEFSHGGRRITRKGSGKMVLNCLCGISTSVE